MRPPTADTRHAVFVHSQYRVYLYSKAVHRDPIFCQKVRDIIFCTVQAQEVLALLPPHELEFTRPTLPGGPCDPAPFELRLLCRASRVSLWTR